MSFRGDDGRQGEVFAGPGRPPAEQDGGFGLPVFMAGAVSFGKVATRPSAEPDHHQAKEGE
jgi:hypothetical protein